MCPQEEVSSESSYIVIFIQNHQVIFQPQYLMGDST